MLQIMHDKNKTTYLDYCVNMRATHLLYKFTFVESFPQQLFLDDTGISSIRVSDLFLYKK